MGSLVSQSYDHEGSMQQADPLFLVLEPFAMSAINLQDRQSKHT